MRRSGPLALQPTVKRNSVLDARQNKDGLRAVAPLQGQVIYRVVHFFRNFISYLLITINFGVVYIKIVKIIFAVGLS